MRTEDLKRRAENLEQMIAKAEPERRLALQPQFSELLERMKSAGQTVPNRMRDLDAALIEEAIEARFDNMPV